MAMFDSLIDDLAGRFGLGANARTLVKEVLTMISTSPGGLGGFLDKLKSAGLTSEVGSWLGRPDAAPMAAGPIERALGATALGAIAGRLGLAQGAAFDRARIRVAENHRPVDPRRRHSGRCARRGHQFSLTTARRSSDGASGAEADRRSSRRRRERARHPALAMAGARRAGRRCPAFLFLVNAGPDAVCSARRKGAGAGGAGDRRASAGPAAFARANGASAKSAAPRANASAGGADSAPASTDAQVTPPPPPAPASAMKAQVTPPPPPAPAPSTEAQATAPQPAPPAPAATAPPAATAQAPAAPPAPAVATADPTAPASTPTATRFALSNDNGAVRASGVVPDQDAKASITDALNAVFGADKVKSDIGVDKNATPAPWLGAFRAVMDAIKGANVDAIFQGDKINVGGAAMTDSARDKVIAALKGVVGAGVTIGALSDKTAAAIAVANNRATTELASLQSGFGVKDLLFALNDSVVNFASDSSDVPDSAAPFLKIAAADLKQLKAGHVLEVAGYTDNTGDAALNLALSQQRAEAVREALIKYGADPDTLVAKGYGEADPIASNATAEGRLKNRRIEYHVLKAPT